MSAKIALKAFNKDSINANIKKLSFKEQSGFSLNKLTLNLVGNKDSLSVKNFEVRLPETTLKIAQATVDLSKVDSTSQLINNALLNYVLPLRKFV